MSHVTGLAQIHCHGRVGDECRLVMGGLERRPVFDVLPLVESVDLVQVGRVGLEIFLKLEEVGPVSSIRI